MGGMLATVAFAAALSPGMGRSAAPSTPAPAAFARCASCHAAARGAGAEIGPNLYGVVGSRAGARPGYDYSPALRKSGVVWNRATLTRWLNNDQAVAPGTVMPNQALTPADRDAIVSYLLTLK